MKFAWLLLVLTQTPTAVRTSASNAPASVSPSPADAPKRTARPGGLPSLVPSEPLHPQTQCGACHTTAGWSDVKFNHEKTGFPLLGRHAEVDCKGCHPVDFARAVPTGCVGCHRDGHQGDLGQHCEGCHDQRSWLSTFSPDAHRRTAFPLVGAHAIIPCQECHADARDRRFSRPAVPCASCHQGDLDRTRGTAVDHQSLGFSQDCLTCHRPIGFRPARFPAHDACYRISSGPHAAVTCEQCHSSLIARPATGMCNTGTETCTSCHEHACSIAGGQTRTDQQHAKVAGYQCANRKCYECHQGPGK